MLRQTALLCARARLDGKVFYSLTEMEEKKYIHYSSFKTAVLQASY